MAPSRTIIVTGASSGIGAYCARALKRDGWRVFATARKAGDLRQLEEHGIEAFYLDYREAESIEALVEAVLDRTGGTLDALYNNGAHAQAGAVEDLPMHALREQFEANFFGWHDLTRRIVPVMRRQGHGRIVHCSSILGLVPVKFRGAYAASKHAIEGLMLCQRAELDLPHGAGGQCQQSRHRHDRLAQARAFELAGEPSGDLVRGDHRIHPAGTELVRAGDDADDTQRARRSADGRPDAAQHRRVGGGQ